METELEGVHLPRAATAERRRFQRLAVAPSMPMALSRMAARLEGA